MLWKLFEDQPASDQTESARGLRSGVRRRHLDGSDIARATLRPLCPARVVRSSAALRRNSNAEHAARSRSDRRTAPPLSDEYSRLNLAIVC